METLEVIVVYLVTYASLIIVIGIAAYMAGLAIVERRRARRAVPEPASERLRVRVRVRSPVYRAWIPRRGHQAGPISH